MGETGCGKTRLINYFSLLHQRNLKKNLIHVKIHGGTTAKVIEEKLREAVKLSKENFKQIQASINMAGNSLRFSNTRLNYGSSDIQLVGEVRDFVDYISGKKQLKPSLTINCKNLNLDEYFSSEETSDPNSFLLPEDISGIVNVNAQKVIYDQHQFNQLTATIKIEDKNINVPQFSAQNAEAGWKGNIHIIEKTPSKLQLSGNLSTNQVELKKLFGEWHNLYQDNLTSEHILHGKAALNVNFDLPFDAQKEEVNIDEMKATMRLSLTNGRFRNIPLFKEMTSSMKSNASKLVLGKRNIDYLDAKLADVTIPNLENTISISNGNIIIPKMTINSSAMQVELTGVHGFNDIIDYRVELNARDLREVEQQSEFGEIAYEENGARLFLHVSGHLDNLDFSWDKGAHKEQIKENLKEEKEEIKAMLKSEFGLFKKDSTVKKYEPKQVVTKDEIKITFGQKSTLQDPKPEEKQKEKKEGALKKTIKSWKSAEEEEEQQVTTFKIGG